MKVTIEGVANGYIVGDEEREETVVIAGDNDVAARNRC
jgi:hypothetical protein